MNKKFKKRPWLVLAVSLVLSIFMTGCSDNEGDLKDKSSIQNQDAIEKQNENDALRAKMLQSSINKLRNFIDAVEGEYLGSYRPGSTLFRTRITITSTFPRYESDHIKSLNELEYELQNLNLNIKAVSWTDDGDYSGGCSFSNIRPDIENGFVRAFSQDCPNDYYVYLSDSNSSSGLEKENAKSISQRIKKGQLLDVESLFVTKTSIHNPKVNKFYLNKE